MKCFCQPLRTMKWMLAGELILANIVELGYRGQNLRMPPDIGSLPVPLYSALNPFLKG